MGLPEGQAGQCDVLGQDCWVRRHSTGSAALCTNDFTPLVPWLGLRTPQGVESPWEVCAPILLAGSGYDSVLREGAKRPSEPSNMEGGGRSSQSPSSVAQVGTLLAGLGKLWQSRAGRP